MPSSTLWRGYKNLLIKLISLVFFSTRLKVYIIFEDPGFCRSCEISDENLIGKKNGQVNRQKQASSLSCNITCPTESLYHFKILSAVVPEKCSMGNIVIGENDNWTNK